MTKVPTKDQVEAAHAVLMAAREAEDVRRAEADRKYVGKCFRYRNSYSAGNGWWLYCIVTHMDEHRTLRGWKFQKDNDGRVSIETGHPFMGLSPNSGYAEIPAADFWREAATLCSELTKLMVPR